MIKQWSHLGETHAIDNEMLEPTTLNYEETILSAPDALHADAKVKKKKKKKTKNLAKRMWRMGADVNPIIQSTTYALCLGRRNHHQKYRSDTTKGEI